MYASWRAVQHSRDQVKKSITDAYRNVKNDWIGLLEMSVRYYTGIDTSVLSDEELAKTYAKLRYVRELEAEGKDIEIDNVKPTEWQI